MLAKDTGDKELLAAAVRTKVIFKNVFIYLLYLYFEGASPHGFTGRGADHGDCG